MLKNATSPSRDRVSTEKSGRRALASPSDLPYRAHHVETRHRMRKTVVGGVGLHAATHILSIRARPVWFHAEWSPFSDSTDIDFRIVHETLLALLV